VRRPEGLTCLHKGQPPARRRWRRAYDASSMRSPSRGVGRPRAHPRARGASESGDRVSVAPGCTEEKQGSPRYLGRPRACVPWSKTPPGALYPRPLTDRGLLPSDGATSSAPGLTRFRGCIAHGPHVRVPTHRRRRRRLRRKARYRLGGLTLGRAGVEAAGRQTEFEAVASPLGRGRGLRDWRGRDGDRAFVAFRRSAAFSNGSGT
jgi:hypothetical protein